MSKARKIAGIHVDCPACGAGLVVDSETGDVAAYPAGGKAPGGPGAEPDPGGSPGASPAPGGEPEPKPKPEPEPEPKGSEPEPEPGPEPAPVAEPDDTPKHEANAWERGAW